MCAVSEERESSASGIGSQMGDSLVNLPSDSSHVDGIAEPAATSFKFPSVFDAWNGVRTDSQRSQNEGRVEGNRGQNGFR